LEPLGVSSNQIHRVTGEDQPELAASKAEVELRRIVPSDANGQPLLDLILLGMGEDGHVASLFPTEDKALVSDKAIYRAVRNSPKPPPNRVTLGYSAIAAADRVWVLAAGAGKHEALRESLRPEGRTPLSHVLRLRRQTHIFSDISLK
jgi:6-phosphogluconolactonase